MTRNGLIGIVFLLMGSVLIFGKFHLYASFAGGLLIVIGGTYLRKVNHAMLKKTLEYTEKKRLEKIAKKAAEDS
jgi:Flp pilus assembly protein protease CpaA